MAVLAYGGFHKDVKNLSVPPIANPHGQLSPVKYLVVMDRLQLILSCSLRRCIDNFLFKIIKIEADIPMRNCHISSPIRQKTVFLENSDSIFTFPKI
mmetsp:Transcript_3273/g.8492  ORF Transcript_3273/g.8492 Transcript_3273/m.8492 type:complete len:97 (+) Transcript_3273:68-358(+)